MWEVRDRYGLTDRQREVIELWVSGLTGKQIGRKLGISSYAVHSRLTQAHKAAGAQSTIEMLSKLGAIRLPWEESVNG